MDHPTATYPELTSALREGIIRKAAAALREIYVYVDAAERMAAHLEGKLRRGTVPKLVQPVVAPGPPL